MTSRRQRGRPQKLTRELQEMLCKVLCGGSYLDTAAALVGVDRVTIYRWIKLGKAQKSGKYERFRTAVRRAIASAEAREVLRIDAAAETDWRASAFLLGRRFPKRWGRAREEISAKPPAPKDTIRGIREFLEAAGVLEGDVDPDDRRPPSPNESKEESA